MAIFVSLSAQSLRALSLELRNVSDNQIFSGIEFTRITKTQAAVAKQYLKIEYPEIINQDIRIYTNNANWRGIPNERAGLVAIRNAMQSLPLYWKSFSTPQPGGVSLTPTDIATWNKIMDLSDSQLARNRRLANIPLEPGRASYIYFATLVPAGASLGSYITNLVVDQVSPVADIRAPVLAGVNCDQMPQVESMNFQTLIEDEFNVAAATFYYRPAKETAYNARPLALTQQGENSTIWTADAAFTREELPIGSYEYYIEANDGFTRSSRGLAEAPLTFRVVDEFAEFSGVISGNEDFAASNPCALLAGIPDLFFPAGGIADNTTITLRRILPQFLLSQDGRSAVSAFEFGPKGMVFKRPAALTFPYADANQDGIVDGTDIPEKELKIFWFDGFEWRNMGGKIDTARNVVKTDILHFSVYGLLPAGPLTGDAIRPREKIITPNGDGINDFAQFTITDDFEISIFDVQGRRIRRLENINVWDGKTDDGASAESGVYVYQVRTKQLDKTVSGTIGVAR